MPTRLSSTGTLKENDLVQILESLLANKSTGTLNLQNQAQVKSIYLKDGVIIFASSNLQEDRLGEMLLKSKIISQEQLKISIDLIKRTGKRQGTAMVEEGFLNPKELFEGLKFQVKEIFASIFLWDEVQWSFLEGEISRQVIPLKLDIEELISEAVQRVQQEIPVPS